MKRRFLTHQELTFILSPLRPIYSVEPCVAHQIFDRIYRSLYNDLAQERIDPSHIPKLQRRIIHAYNDSQIQAGESVGVLTAQNVGEQMTQQTLNTFHRSGNAIATVITGVPRFAELLNATKHPKSIMTTIFPIDPCPTLASIKELFHHQLKAMTFRDVVLSWTLYHDTTFSEQNDVWYSLYTQVYDEQLPSTFTYKIRCILHRDLLYRYKLTTAVIARQLNEQLNNTNNAVRCIHAPTSIGIMDVWINPASIRHVLDTCNAPDLSSMIEEYMDEHIKLFSMHIAGIQGIEDFMFVESPRDGWYINTVGQGLADILCLSEVDPYRTYSNHMWEIYEILGTEATRQFLLEEYKRVVCSDTYINERHISLLVDMMMYTGTITSVSRYGMIRNQSGPLSKTSFEESLENFLKAGIYNEVENTTGVSAAVMVGKQSNIGTGLCELIYKDA